MKLSADFEVQGDRLLIRKLILETGEGSVDLHEALSSLKDIAPRLLEIHPQKANIVNIKRCT